MGTGMTDRSCIVDVFENYFGVGVASLTPEDVAALPRDQAGELVEMIDAFLESASVEAVHPEAISLDGLCNPIIVADDPSEPTTTRRAKQVALMHREVMIPMQPLIVDFDLSGARYPAALLRWVKANATLLREHVFTLAARPNILVVHGEKKVRALVGSLVDELMKPEHATLRERLRLQTDTTEEEVRSTIDASLYSVLSDMGTAAHASANLGFVDNDAAALHEFVLGALPKEGLGADGRARHANLLKGLTLPSIDSVRDEDFVGIRQDSEGFAEFRGALGRVLARTDAGVIAGGGLDAEFRDNLDEIRWRAELLRKEVGKKAFRKWFGPTLGSVTIGGVVSTSAAAMTDLASSGAASPAGLAARLGTTVALATLAAIMLESSPTRKQRLLRFYEVLLEEER
jgi:hypothetical protein